MATMTVEKYEIEDPKMIDFQRQTPDMVVTHREHRTSDSEGSSVPPMSPGAPYAETGAPINRSQTAELKKGQNPGLAWPRIRRTCREALSEFMGVFILIMFGDGVVAQVVLSGGEKGDYQSISWGWVSLYKSVDHTQSLTPSRALVSCSVCTPRALVEATSTLP